MRALICALAVAAAAPLLGGHAEDPFPRTVEEFRNAVRSVLSDTGVPGAGIALVRTSGIEWAGGVGVADRDHNTPVTATTHFRAGSISKTFVAAALVQLYLDSEIDLDAPVAEIAPEIRIDNAWEPATPVRVIHLLQHTAGFDDMHFNEIYAGANATELSLESVLTINPASRVVRWRPGTRMSYSNPGYAIAGYLIEKVTGVKFEDRIAERIFKPAGMPTSSFHLTGADHATLASGYRDRTGPAVAYSPIYLRPAGNLHTSALELGNFVHLLLNWGETATELVIDPEYLSNMEHPRTTLASDAGLRNGYGSGIASSSIEGFPMLGHAGGIDGFMSRYAYSTSRDVGFVILLNSTHSGEAMRRVSALALRYLKAGVEMPARPRAVVAEAVLRAHAGYYHPANPRHQALAFIEWLLSGESVSVTGDRLSVKPLFADSRDLIPVSDSLFRFETDPEASRVFTKDASGVPIFAGAMSYSERRSRWQIEIIRWPVLISAALVVTPLAALPLWVVRGVARRLVRRSAQRQAASAAREGGWVRFVLLLCGIAFGLPVIGALNVTDLSLGSRNVWTAAIFAGSVLMPAAAILAFLFTIDAWRNRAGRGFLAYALTVSIAALVISGYLSAWGMIDFMPWSF